jgi:hypothetical protein
MTQIPTIGIQSLIAIPRQENVRDLHQYNQIRWYRVFDAATAELYFCLVSDQEGFIRHGFIPPRFCPSKLSSLQGFIAES